MPTIAPAELTAAQLARRAAKKTPSELSGWLRRQTATLAVNFVKAGNVEDLALLVERRRELDDAIATAVAGYRAAGHSWAEIGKALGVTKQSAQGKYGHATWPAAAGSTDL